jgi:hypothetical protein
MLYAYFLQTQEIKFLQSLFIFISAGLINQAPTILKQTLFKSVGLMNQAPTQDESNLYDFQAGIDNLRSFTWLKSKDRI